MYIQFEYFDFGQTTHSIKQVTGKCGEITDVENVCNAYILYIVTHVSPFNQDLKTFLNLFFVKYQMKIKKLVLRERGNFKTAL